MPAPLQAASSSRPTAAQPFAVHRCRFVDFTPSAITAIAFPPLALPKVSAHTSKNINRSGRRFGSLAVGRANGNIEIYEWATSVHEQERSPRTPQAWVLSRILYGPVPSKVDSLVFTLKYPYTLAYNQVPALEDLRLFSAGGGSELVEWDLTSGTVLRTLNSQGGAIWCMSANPASTVLALGCEDGRIRLLDVASNELAHVKRLDRVKCRILSIAWGPPIPPTSAPKNINNSEDSEDDDEDDWEDLWIVSGGSDSALRKWDVKTGRVLDRMSTDKAKGDRTLIWTVGVLADGTIVSGDSLGVVKFWDSKTCTQLHSFPAHGADVLCLAIGPDGNSVFTSGVDQKVSLFTYVRNITDGAEVTNGRKARLRSRWIHSTSKRMHSHDVRALAIWPPYLPVTPNSRFNNMWRNPFSCIAPVLASGGLDASLVLAPCASASFDQNMLINPLVTSTVSTFEDAYHRRLAYPTGLNSAITVSKRGRLLVLARDTGVSVWHILGKAKIPSQLEEDLIAAQAADVGGEGSNNGNAITEKEECGYERLLDMDLDTTTNISACAISDDGNWLAVSDAYEVKLFELLDQNGTKQPRRVKTLMSVLVEALASCKISGLKEPEGASTLGFSPDSSRLVVSTARSARLVVIDLTNRTPEDRPLPTLLRVFEHHALTSAVFGDRVVKKITKGERDHGDSEGNESDSNERDMDGDIEMNEDGPHPTFTPDDAETRTTITHMAFSSDGQWFATTDSHCRTRIFNLDSVQHHALLPTSPSLVSALAFSSQSPTSSSRPSTLLVLAHTDSTIIVYDVEARQFSPWAHHLSQRDNLPKRWTSLHDSVLGITVEPFTSNPSNLSSPFLGRSETPCSSFKSSQGHDIIMWGSTWLCKIALNAPVGWGGFAKKRRRGGQNSSQKSKSVSTPNTQTSSALVNGNAAGDSHENDDVENEETLSNFKIVTRYRPNLFVDFLDGGELLIVERPLGDVLRELPPAFFKPRYGT